MTARRYTIGEVADLAHVSVRTLHHYDAIGLLVPSGRTPGGYRTYDEADLTRLRRILYYRSLDFGLDAVAAMLAEPGETAQDHLRRQHRLVSERIGRHRELLAALERELEAREMGMSLTPEEQFEVFGTDKVGSEWTDEARERWGDTDAYRQSQRRAAAYSKDDWTRMKEESDAGLRAFRDAMTGGLAASSSQARELAEAHRQFITRWFYDCGYDLHRGLADLYLADERFRRTYDEVTPGLAQYVHDAIHANADHANA